MFHIYKLKERHCRERERLMIKNNRGVGLRGEISSNVKEAMIMMMMMIMMVANIHKHIVLTLCEDIVQSIVYTVLI